MLLEDDLRCATRASECVRLSQQGAGNSVVAAGLGHKEVGQLGDWLVAAHRRHDPPAGKAGDNALKLGEQGRLETRAGREPRQDLGGRDGAPAVQ
jgi:hypothetical protein